MHLVFSSIHPSQPSRTLGPFPRVWLNVEGLRSEAGGGVVAAYRKHQWDVEGLSYFRLHSTSKVSIQFSRGAQVSREYGEFNRFLAVNGLAYADDHVIAYLDYKKDEWLFYDSGYHWPVMLVSDAA